MPTDMKHISILFVVAAFYDGILGLIFLVVPITMLHAVGVPYEDHPGYIQFAAALLVVFALMFIAVARHPVPNRNLIPYGILLKVSYCGVVFSYWIAGRITSIWKPFAILDVAWGLLFFWAYRDIGSKQGTL